MTLKLRFAAPQPASVAASDWSAEPYEVTSTGREAVRVLAWLESQALDLDAPGLPSIEDLNRAGEEGGRS